MVQRALPLLLLLASPVFAQVPGLKVPDGFTVAEFSKPDLANDIYTMHIDKDARIVVTGRGYVRQLHASKPGGAADSATEILPAPKDGPMGMLWEGETFYLVSDGGLWKYTGVNGKTLPQAKPEKLLTLKTGGEHDAHAVRRGADGHLYLLCGNFAQVAKLTLSKDSPVKAPVAGAMLRLSKDEKEVEAVCDGFRNAYDFDFNTDNEPFTFDSDNERCIGLPWYEPTRFYHVRRGGNYGWRAPQHGQFFRLPPYYPDVVAPICTLGRGSPTAVTGYRHTHFPEKYRNGFFLADWTFGKIWFVPTKENGDTYTGKPELFLESTGENGFAPTGMAVHPKTGELYISIGGRGTRGGVFKVSFKEREGKGEALAMKDRDRKAVKTENKAVVPDKFPTVESVRTLQRAWGDLGSIRASGRYNEGYSLSRIPGDFGERLIIHDELVDAFPSKTANLDRELSRTIAALGLSSASVEKKCIAKLTEVSDPLEDVHYIFVLACCSSVPFESKSCSHLADALVRLDAKYEKQKIGRDRHWHLRMAEAVTDLLKKHKTLAESLVKHADFGQPAHTWLVNLPGLDRKAVAKKLLANAAKDKSFAWTGGLVECLSALPDDETHDLLKKLASRPELEEVALPLLANQPRQDEHTLFLAGLKNPSGSVARASAEAMAKLTGEKPNDELTFTLHALRRFSDEKADAAIQKALLALLKNRTKQELGPKFAAWEAWVKKEKPDLLKAINATLGYDEAAWKERLKDVAWDKGEAKRGAALFVRGSCAACHNGGSAVGPSLEGITKRFSRDDLMIAILDPSRDVSARYRTTKIATLDGKAYEGVMIYEAPDGIILQVSADRTVRIAGNNIDTQKPGTLSLMPVGLLDKFTNEEIADLVAYLKTLGPKKE